MPVRGTGETIAAVCPEFRSDSGTWQTQIVRPWRSNREICCCPHLDRRSSADSLFVGVHVTTPSSRERDEHRCKTVVGNDNHRAANNDNRHRNHTGSACPFRDGRAAQSSDAISSTRGTARNGNSANRHAPETYSDVDNHHHSSARDGVSNPGHAAAYDRHDWKHWTDSDGDCQDARDEGLIAESRTAVAYRTDGQCRVVAGEWLTPYSATIVTDARKLDVDHMVPLGNAHGSIAKRWTAAQLERDTNFLKDPQHLIAVTDNTNQSKGARGFEEWKPENRT